MSTYNLVKPLALFPQNSSEESDCSGLGETCILLDKKLAGWLSSEGGYEWSYIQLASGDNCPSEISTVSCYGYSINQCLNETI